MEMKNVDMQHIQCLTQSWSKKIPIWDLLLQSIPQRSKEKERVILLKNWNEWGMEKRVITSGSA